MGGSSSKAPPGAFLVCGESADAATAAALAAAYPPARFEPGDVEHLTGLGQRNYANVELVARSEAAAGLLYVLRRGDNSWGALEALRVLPDHLPALVLVVRAAAEGDAPEAAAEAEATTTAGRDDAFEVARKLVKARLFERKTHEMAYVPSASHADVVAAAAWLVRAAGLPA